MFKQNQFICHASILKTNNGTGAASYFLKPDTPVPILFMFSYKTFLVVLLSNVS
ncbi:hypothetical protein EFW11_1516 [Enterococcus faecalis]|nr:hypothetical protein EFW11_1516 [Enterococcus faecalis]